ncbi:MAG: putative damage-inducible protein DinB [Parasphingorhabdus sp.]|jgi:uncharacterized damage-inducible protein DinB
MTYLQNIILYKKWSNQLLYSTARELTEAQLIAPRSIIFGNIIRTLNHTFAMDLVWQAHLLGRQHGFTKRTPDHTPGLDKLFHDQKELDDWFITYADTLPSRQENEVIDFTFIGGEAGSMCRRDILLHVVNHGTYHRGNVTGIMYECGLQPPTTEYPVFLKGQKISM